MKKFKVFVDVNEEEKFLNGKAKQGHLFEKYSCFGRYHFKEGQPQDLNYKVDYRVFNKKSDFNNYVTLFEDAGWEHVYGTKYSGSQYFLPNSNNLSDDIFSDNQSKAKRYERLSKACQLSSLVCITYFISTLVGANFKLSGFLFLTPGLWDKEGIEFLRAFLFELPFVILRVVPIWILLAMSIIYGVWAVKAKKLYEKKINEED